MNFQNIKNLVEKKYISVQKHPTENLWIYNYTQKCQYEKVWTEETLQCRGLIMNDKNEVIARPFKKFFNLGEYVGPLPPGEPVVWEKYDGSLGILYWVNDMPYLATRGSFTSDQARKGTEMLHRYYLADCFRLDRSKTYLFEIIYPENRIVVDYSGREYLIHLATIDTETGRCEKPDSDFPLALHHNFRFPDLPQRENAEGYVLQWEDGFRLKVKHDEYVRLHRLVTQVTARSIWDLLRNNLPIDELLEKVPDEFYNWVQDVISRLDKRYKEISFEAMRASNLAKGLSTRREQAISIFASTKYSSVAFAYLDQKDADSLIWKMLKPPHEVPFKQEI